jgi:hypothetical protein
VVDIDAGVNDIRTCALACTVIIFILVVSGLLVRDAAKTPRSSRLGDKSTLLSLHTLTQVGLDNGILLDVLDLEKSI